MPAWLHVAISDPWSVLYAHGWVASVVAALAILAMRVRAVGRDSNVDAVSMRDRIVFLMLAIGAVLVFLAQELVRDLAATLFVNPDWTTNFIWWRYVGPPAALLVPLISAAVVLRRARRDVEVRVPPSAARDWSTFSSRSALWCASVALGSLASVSILAGMQSSQAADGAFRLLRTRGYEIYGDSRALQEEGMDYFGWSYSAPVLVISGLLVIAVWVVLRENALRPYRRPETAASESRVRSSLASSITMLLTGSVLLTTAIALRDIGNAGLPWGFMSTESIDSLPIGGEFEALSRVLLALAALMRPIGLTFVLIGGTIGWLPSLIARRGLPASRGTAQPVTEVGQ
ncbi:hypothetical protein HDC34_000372 [Pseudoclavibacter sp. JAI123]|uniref:hypothetical protein n=1 Tax=Pseudoclavibacter sp. JAI123 TaxID=2723065 RepID=UPI0015CD93B3|nr:hypothetical protein [Pseudoclavibacter sp. JAI123]NYF12078.1 hypothetical protein [Pseudoclavibacter sp. JAI123]